MHGTALDVAYPRRATRAARSRAGSLDDGYWPKRAAELGGLRGGPMPKMGAAAPLWPAVVLVLLPFVSGYYLSYLYRSINALISRDLVAEFALSPGDLGFLTATYFLAFAAIQLPLGIWLDRFGPRRVQAILLAIAAGGAALFASASGFVELAVGRALIGLGVAGALMAGLKVIVLWFPPGRIAQINGWFIMLGALGAVSATTPAELVLAQLGWRGIFAGLAAVTVASALLILMVVPERHQDGAAKSKADTVGLAAIYCDRRFWRLAPLSASCIGSAWALQGLWAAPWLADVDGLDRPGVVNHLFVMAVALSVSALLLGLGAERLLRRGVSLSTSLAGATGLALIAQLALVLRWPVPAWLPWIVIAAIGAGTVLSYAIVSELFPKSASGRANGALNLLHVGTAFAVQCAIGFVVEQWPAEAGRAPPIAYRTALGFNLIGQLLAFAWFVRPDKHAAVSRLPPHPIHAMAARMDLAPTTAVSYALARQAWTVRIAHARAQQQTWRAAAFASFAVLAVLATSLGTTLLSRSVAAHVIVPRAEEGSENPPAHGRSARRLEMSDDFADLPRPPNTTSRSLQSLTPRQDKDSHGHVHQPAFRESPTAR